MEEYGLFVMFCKEHQGWHWLWTMYDETISEDERSYPTFASANMAGICWAITKGPAILKEQFKEYQGRFQ